MRDFTNISPDVRRKVKERDSIEGAACCIYCGSPYGVEIAHYVPRSKGGVGQPTNLACLCKRCHMILDNGDPTKAKEIKEVFKDWLERNYPNWSEEGQVYRK